MGQQASKKSKKGGKDRDDQGASVKVVDADNVPSDDEGNGASSGATAFHSDAKTSLYVLTVLTVSRVEDNLSHL